MNLVRAGSLVVNLDFMALASHPAPGQLNLHLAIPRVTAMVDLPAGHAESRPVALDHYVVMFQGEEAEKLWSEIEKLAPSVT